MRYPIEDGMSLLMFLWEWKVATTSAIATKFSPTVKPTSVHRRLIRLKSAGYITSITNRAGTANVWALTRQGFNKIQPLLSELHTNEFKAKNVGKALIAMTAMIGDWLGQTPEGVEFCSEQFLKRVRTNQFPSWVPQTDVHVATGYWSLPKLPVGQSIALEVELSNLRFDHYDKVADFYERYPSVANVIWIAPFASSVSGIERRIQERLQTTQTKHLFLPMREFVKLGWQTKFRNGEFKNRTLSDFLVTKASHPHHQGACLQMLETRKKPEESTTQQIDATHSFFN